MMMSTTRAFGAARDGQLPLLPAEAAEPAQAIGSWTVMDDADIAGAIDGGAAAVAAAQADARLALAARHGAARARHARFRTLSVRRELRGGFVAFTATVLAEA
jgi:hypothetical protein